MNPAPPVTSNRFSKTGSSAEPRGPDIARALRQQPPHPRRAPNCLAPASPCCACAARYGSRSFPGGFTDTVTATAKLCVTKRLPLSPRCSPRTEQWASPLPKRAAAAYARRAKRAKLCLRLQQRLSPFTTLGLTLRPNPATDT